jgi:hypothetical protein
MSMIGMLYAVTPDALAAAIEAGEPDESGDIVLDVHKSWDALNVLLATSPARLADRWEPDVLDPLLGGTEFGDDLGYGPARFLTPEQVAQVAANIAAIDDAELQRRFDPDAFMANDVYGADWSSPGELEELLQRVQAVRNFYRAAADANLAVILLLT